MSTNILKLKSVLTPDEVSQIDTFAVGHKGIDSLQEWVPFLSQKFSFNLITDPDIVTGFISDSSHLPGHAHALCRPTSEHDCAVISRACFKASIPFTLSAGRSNLTGSATPLGGVIIVLTKMVIPEIAVDISKKTVRSPVGIILEDLRNEILVQSNQKLIFPVNPTSRKDATVGGAIACNASGFTPGEDGAMRNWVESLDFIFPNGLILCVNRGEYVSKNGKFILSFNSKKKKFPVPVYPRVSIKNAGGPYSSANGTVDLLDLIIGSEGIFGIITACTLNLKQRPLDYLDLFFSLPEENNALEFLEYLRKMLVGNFSKLSALEYFGVNCRKYMDHKEQLFRGDDQVAIYIQTPLTNKTIEDYSEEWFQILVESGCSIDEDAILLLDNDHDRATFMESRHSLPANSLEVVQRDGTYTIMTDTVVPQENFKKFLKYTHGIINSEGFEYLSFGHLGDCHLHFMILPKKEELAKAAEVYNKIIEKSAKLGGVYSGEHGTGKRKRNDFIKCHGQKALESVRYSKTAIDPNYILNRGNVLKPK